MRPYLIGFAALVAVACDRPKSDLREWQRTDHDHTEQPSAGQVEVRPDAGSPLAAQGLDEVTLASWKANCVKCHGTVGAGDGPQGPMTRARDLTDGAWQAATTDEAIAAVIRNGRGRMPGFQLPDATVKSLVRLVRLFDARRRPTEAVDP